jgi:hypothetical protein
VLPLRMAFKDRMVVAAAADSLYSGRIGISIHA